MNPQGLLELGRHLKRSGYDHVAVTPTTHDIHHRRAGRALARNLRDVLGWSLPFERTAVSPQEHALLSEAGVLETESEGERLRATVRWARLGDHLFAHSAYPTHEEDAVFFGPDTYRFARMIRDHASRHPERAARARAAADIGCGSGAAAVLLAEVCPNARIVATDVNPMALELARVNAALNLSPARGDALRFLQGSLLDGAEGDFDLIVANPPYMLDGAERAYRHGGGDLGEGLSQRIVEVALERLAPGGTLLLYTGIAIVDGRDPFREFLDRTLASADAHWTYEEIDPDVFSEELLKPGYERAERIAIVGLTLRRGPA